MKNLLTKIQTVSNKGVLLTKKHSPLLLMVGAGVGVGATVYLSIKSGRKLEEIVQRHDEAIEDAMMEMGNMHYTKEAMDENLTAFTNNIYPRKEFIMDVAKAVAPPVLAGVVTIGLATGSYTIMMKRITGLSAALTLSNQERQFYKEEVRSRYGDEVATQFEHGYKQVVDENNEKRLVQSEDRPSQTDTYVRWTASEHYVIDDAAYNDAMIKDKITKLEEYMDKKGVMTLNMVYDFLGFPTTAAGTQLGFNDSVAPNFTWHTSNVSSRNEDSWLVAPEVTISWCQPVYIYADIDHGIE